MSSQLWIFRRQCAAGRRSFHEIKKSIYAFIEQNQYKAVYTVSGGIVKNGDVDNSFENAMKLSEFALSEAKERGKTAAMYLRRRNTKII